MPDIEPGDDDLLKSLVIEEAPAFTVSAGLAGAQGASNPQGNES